MEVSREYRQESGQETLQTEPESQSLGRAFST